jgi:hypothetical protein
MTRDGSKIMSVHTVPSAEELLPQFTQNLALPGFARKSAATTPAGWILSLEGIQEFRRSHCHFGTNT